MGKKIRNAHLSDIDSIMIVIDAAKDIMRASGNRNQWIRGYPSKEVIFSDIDKGIGYVVEDEEVCAYFAFAPSPEPSYAHIYDDQDGKNGAWLDDEPYYVIHRLASLPQFHGIFNQILQWAFERTHSIRVDTHRDNIIMQHNFQKHGFVYCGIIYLASGDERLAFQKNLINTKPN